MQRLDYPNGIKIINMTEVKSKRGMGIEGGPEENSLREYLKNARLSLGMTQEDVAKRIGISTNYYCSIEKGERQQDMKASILIALSEVLRIPVSEMLNSERKLNLNS